MHADKEFKTVWYDSQIFDKVNIEGGVVKEAICLLILIEDSHNILLNARYFLRVNGLNSLKLFITYMD